MNLVAKEYCASNIEENGVLILSEFAGAAAELRKGALMVNPHDIKGVANAINKAFNMPLEERSTRMKKMRHVVKRHDVFDWVDSFLNGAFAKDLSSFPIMDDYMPEAEIEE